MLIDDLHKVVGNISSIQSHIKIPKHWDQVILMQAQVWEPLFWTSPESLLKYSG